MSDCDDARAIRDRARGVWVETSRQKCAEERDEGYAECERSEDRGYSRCDQERDDGHRDCCTWWPCSWFCDAWVWLSHLVCALWTWMKNVVCTLWTWAKNLVCVAWTWVVDRVWQAASTIAWAGCKLGDLVTRIFEGRAVPDPVVPGDPLTPEDVFPEGFLWGAATASYQVEGYPPDGYDELVENDWKSFVMDPANRERVYFLSALSYGKQNPTRINLLPPGEAVRHWQRDAFRADLDRCALLGLNAYRLSLEWSRIQPTEPGWVGQYRAARTAATKALDDADRLRTRGPDPGESREAFEARVRALLAESDRQVAVATALLDEGPRPADFDDAAVARYREMVDDLLRRGMAPIVTLSHMTLPLWVQTPPKTSAFVWIDARGADPADADFRASLAGWMNPATVSAFVKFVRHVVPRFTDVRDWLTLNEPVGSVVFVGYIGGVWPPGFVGDGSHAKDALRNLVWAHVRAYDVIKQAYAEADAPEPRVGFAHAVVHAKPSPEANVFGDNQEAAAQFAYSTVTWFLNAVVKGVDDPEIWRTNRDVAEHEGWKGKLDFIGVNYYRSMYIYHDVPTALQVGWIGGRQAIDRRGIVDKSKDLLTDLGWEVYPAGLYFALKGLHAQYQLPIMVSENGMSETAEKNRAPHVVAHLEHVLRAMRADSVGAAVPVLGYLYWSIVDNWEWAENYRREAAFGLFTVERAEPSLRRRITEGALAYRQVIAEAAVGQSADRFGSIPSAGKVVTPPAMSSGATYEGEAGGAAITVYVSGTASGRLTGQLYEHAAGTWHPLEVGWDAATRVVTFTHPVPGGVRTYRSVPGELAGPDDDPWRLSRVAVCGCWRIPVPRSEDTLHVVLNKLEGTFTGKIFGPAFATSAFRDRRVWGSLWRSLGGIAWDDSRIQFEERYVDAYGHAFAEELLTDKFDGTVDGDQMTLTATYPRYTQIPDRTGITFRLDLIPEELTGTRLPDGVPF